MGRDSKITTVRSTSGRRPASGQLYVGQLMREWRMDKTTARIRASVRCVLGQLCGGALLTLKNEANLEVMVTREAGTHVWAFFPFLQGRFRGTSLWTTPKRLKARPDTRVVLHFNAEACQGVSAAKLRDDLRHHLGHVLLFLSDPGAPNECSDADREWRVWAKPVAKKVKSC